MAAAIIGFGFQQAQHSRMHVVNAQHLCQLQHQPTELPITY